MNIEKDTVITLINDKKYIVASVLNYQSNHYAYTNGLDENGNINYKEIVIFQVIKENNNSLVTPVREKSLLNTLIIMFKEKEK